MARKPKIPRTRVEGGRMDTEALDAQLLARDLGSLDLAELTGLDTKTIASLRRGVRVRRSTVLKIVDVLSKVPVRPEIAVLVGVGVPVERNGSEKKTTDGVKRRRSEEVPRAGGRSRKTE